MQSKYSASVILNATQVRASSLSKVNLAALLSLHHAVVCCTRYLSDEACIFIKICTYIHYIYLLNWLNGQIYINSIITSCTQLILRWKYMSKMLLRCMLMLVNTSTCRFFFLIFSVWLIFLNTKAKRFRVTELLECFCLWTVKPLWHLCLLNVNPQTRFRIRSWKEGNCFWIIFIRLGVSEGDWLVVSHYTCGILPHICSFLAGVRL